MPVPLGPARFPFDGSTGHRAALVPNTGSVAPGIPFLDLRQRPLWRLIRVAGVATIRVAVLDRVGRGNEIERVIAGFSANGIFTGLGHVTLDASTAGAEWIMVGMVRELLVLGTVAFLGSMAGQAERVRFTGLDVQ